MPEDSGPPYSAVVYAWDDSRKDYSLSVAELPTLESITRFEGEVTSILGGVNIGIDLLATVETEEEMVDAITISKGKPVAAGWYLQEGVIVAEDFETLLLLSFYSSMERCRQFFREHGLPLDIPGHVQTFHRPTMGSKMFGGFTLIRDNAAFSPLFRAFLLFPSTLLMNNLPLAINEGVVCHEYSHAVFHALVSGESMVPAGSFQGWPVRAENLMRSVDEGFADFFGAALTGDPSFISLSIPDYLDIDRDLSVPRHLDTMMTSGLETELFYDPYPLGSLFAHLLWKTGESTSMRETVSWAIRAIGKIADVADENFEILTVMELFVDSIEQENIRIICNVMEEALLPLPDACSN